MIIKVKGSGGERGVQIGWVGIWVGAPKETWGGRGNEETPLSCPVPEATSRPSEEQFQFQSQQQVQQEVIPAPTFGKLQAPVNPGSGVFVPGLREVTLFCPE